MYNSVYNHKKFLFLKTNPGYQPAQKRLRDRKGRVLSLEDILHYQKIMDPDT